MLTIPFFNFLPSLPQLPMSSRLLDFYEASKQKKLLLQNNLKPYNLKPYSLKPYSLKHRSVQTEVLRKIFVKHLINHNQLRAYLPSGEILTVFAMSYDRINSQLVVSDQAENGLLYLEEGAKVEFFTDLNETHEYFSFISKVIRIKVKGIKLTYYMSVPKVLKKSRRRVIPRVNVKNHSIIRLDKSHFSGRVVDLSANGISLAIKGYYPDPIAIGDVLENCSIDIFQPRHNDNISFDCSIAIRRVDFQSKPEPMTLIGGIFTNYNKQQEDKVFSYLHEHLIP